MNQFNPEISPASRGFPGKQPPRYSTFVPFVIVLVTLIFSVSKDIYFIHKHKITVITENARAGESLARAGEESALIEKLHTDLNHLAPTDPVAAKILAKFFAQPAAPTMPKQEDTENGTKPSAP